MTRKSSGRSQSSGQVLVLFAITLAVLLLVVGLAIDGGNGLMQRRNAQNTADFAALAGARVVAEWIDHDTVNGTDANVKSAIINTVAANGGNPITFGAPDGPTYVDSNGRPVGYVGSGGPPSATVGVHVDAALTFNTYFLGLVGVNNWTASAAATARGGYATTPPSGDMFPAGIAEAFFENYPSCSGDVGSSSDCQPQHLTPGSLNVPGGFGWLSFGCDGYGLGQDPPANNGGCSNSKPFLQEEIGPPAKTFGCCTQVGLPGSADQIGSLPGNKASADCSWYIDHKTLVTVPVWDYAGGNGSNAWYHIVGYAGFQITACDGGKDIEGVWRKEMTEGPVTSTSSYSFQSLAVQLIH
jgi:Putative Flp pilus-assembly TadE/G-like